LRKPLVAGDRIDGELVFENAGPIPVEFRVEMAGQQSFPHADHCGIALKAAPRDDWTAPATLQSGHASAFDPLFFIHP
jgi:hypothetical protein